MDKITRTTTVKLSKVYQVTATTKRYHNLDGSTKWGRTTWGGLTDVETGEKLGYAKMDKKTLLGYLKEWEASTLSN